MDLYLEDKNVVNRLVEEWTQHKNLIVAFDFDNTVFDYYQKGYEFNDVITLLRRCKQIGCKFIVFTSCEEEKYDFIRNYLNENEIPFDTINENLDITPFKGRKVYYNILLDDRAGLRSAYDCLKEAVGVMETKQLKGE